MRKVIGLAGLAAVLTLVGVLPAATIVVWPEQSIKTWNDISAIWETAPDVPSNPPTVNDWVYLMSSNEVQVNSSVSVNRLYIDRALSGYPTAAASVSVLPGGTLAIGGSNGFADFGRSISGATLNIAGGSVIFEGIGRTGSYSLRVQSAFAPVINVNAGSLIVQNGSIMQIDANCQADITVSGNGLIDLQNNSSITIGDGAAGINLSEGGLIKYSSRNASAELMALAQAGKLEGIQPLTNPPFTPADSANGVGWLYDGTNTYVFAVPAKPIANAGVDRLIWLPEAVSGIQLNGEILNYNPEKTYTYNWTGNGVTFSPSAAAEDPVVQFIGGDGVYTLTLQVTDNIGTGSDTVTVQVLDPAKENKLTALWTLDDAAGSIVTDSSNGGFDQPGTIVNVPARDPNWMAGWVNCSGGSLYFNGTDYVDIDADNAPADPNGNLDNIRYGITLASWVNLNVTGTNQYILRKAGSWDMRLMVDGRLRFRMDGLSDQYLDSLTSFGDGYWHHLAATYDALNETASLYVDGFLVNSKTTTGLLAVGDPNVILGSGCVGLLDDVRVYSYALAASEIETLSLMGDSTPAIDAGPNQLYQINPSIPLQLHGSVLDLDSNPMIQWIVISGDPANVAFADVSDPSTLVTINPAAPGTYILQLLVTDTVCGEQIQKTDTMMITANAPSCADVIASGLLLPLDISGPTEGRPDCYINIYDLMYLASSWLECNDPENPECTWPWE